MSRSIGGLVLVALLAPAVALGQAGEFLLNWAQALGQAALGQSGGIQDTLKDFDYLTPDDEQAAPSYPPPPGGSVPSRCYGAESAVCNQCGYAGALSDLQKTRYRLEKLRRVYASGKNVVSHGLAVGDSMAGAAGVGGLAWASERLKILESLKGLQSAYDAKYAELMALLQTSLREIGDCEALVYGEEDWYERYGFMYYEFMAGRYERAD